MLELFNPVDYLFWLALIGFAAGFLDSVVGGGGLIGTPAMLNLFPGWSILNVVGTNRTSSICGTSLAAWNYFRIVRPEPSILWPGCIGALVASFIGVQLAQQIDSERLKVVVLTMIVALAIYSSFKTDLGQIDRRRFTGAAESWAALGVGSVCGFYNGLIGPGTGTLTETMLDAGCEVVACELDRDMAEIVRMRNAHRLGAGAGRVTLVEADCLDGKHALGAGLLAALAGRPFASSARSFTLTRSPGL
jgi:hypothetical protein